jgi:hypothetical protein
MRYVASITNVLSDHLGWHRAQLKFIPLKFMARFTSALFRLTTTDLGMCARIFGPSNLTHGYCYDEPS